MNSHSFEAAQKSVLVVRQIASLATAMTSEKDDPVAGQQMPAALATGRDRPAPSTILSKLRPVSSPNSSRPATVR